MNTGQSILTILAMVLLSVLILRVNNTFLSTGSVMVDSKYVITATSLATSEIQKIQNLAFDANTYNKPIHKTGDLTPPGLLKNTSNKNEKTFNNIDDYDGWSEIVPVTMIPNEPPANFLVSSSVVYVSASNPDQTSSTATWNKKITVTVSNPFMPDTVKLSTIYSYWKFKG